MIGVEVNSSSSVAGILIGYIIVWAFSALICGFLAARKNRSVLGWAVAGIFFPWIAFLVLLFMSYLCPKCHGPVTSAEWKRGGCPRCGGSPAKAADGGPADFAECPSCHAMIPPGETKCPKCGWS